MDADRWGALVTLMARMAAGDRAAVFSLYEQFGAAVAAAVRAHLRRLGVAGISRDELDGLVIDACLELLECAPGWDAAYGVAPWTWATRRIGRRAAGWVGQFCDELDADHLEAVGVGVHGAGASIVPEPELLEVLGGLAGGVGPATGICSLLGEALGRLGSDRDAAILLEYGVQQRLGDPAPAHTVARLYRMKPPAVRKAVQRTRRRLRDLAAAEPRFGALAGLPLIA